MIAGAASATDTPDVKTRRRATIPCLPAAKHTPHYQMRNGMRARPLHDFRKEQPAGGGR